MKTLLIVVLMTAATQRCLGQEALLTGSALHWQNDPALFLEPNRFSTVKEILDPTLWLHLGFGGPIAALGNGVLGLEAVGWSRLRYLSGFRFPVETADYFFGAYYVWDAEGPSLWRLRLSHISSHDVDGKDTVVGGSSSHYSREFVEFDRQSKARDGDRFQWSVGIRVFFHQVTKIDTWVAIPATGTWYVNPYKESGFNLALFASSGDGPVWPNIAGGIRIENHIDVGGISDVQLGYYYGASWAGTDAGAKVSQVKLQVDVRGS